MHWFGRLVVCCRLLLIIVSLIGCVRPTQLGITAIILLLSTYVPPLISYLRSQGEKKEEYATFHAVTFEDMRKEWRNRKRDDRKMIEALVKWYDDRGKEVIQRFSTIQTQTQCRFAKRAHLWAAPIQLFDWSTATSGNDLERYVNETIVDPFLVFSVLCEWENLDGFVVELPEKYSSELRPFSKAVYRILKALDAASPTDFKCMALDEFVGQNGWVFSFNRTTYFITTFAPFYPASSCRYAFHAENGYILFQPELSFAKHSVSLPKPDPGPHDVRVQIREAFKEAGRPYRIVDPRASVAAHTIFSPDDCSTVRWWLQTPEGDDESSAEPTA